MKPIAVIISTVLIALAFLSGSSIQWSGSDESEFLEEPVTVKESLTLPYAVAGTKRQKNGAACLRDNDCISRECKRFRCVERVKRLKSLGESCWYDGDCQSGECKGFKCVRKGD